MRTRTIVSQFRDWVDTLSFREMAENKDLVRQIEEVEHFLYSLPGGNE